MIVMMTMTMIMTVMVASRVGDIRMKMKIKVMMIGDTVNKPVDSCRDAGCMSKMFRNVLIREWWSSLWRRQGMQSIAKGYQSFDALSIPSHLWRDLCHSKGWGCHNFGFLVWCVVFKGSSP